VLGFFVVRVARIARTREMCLESLTDELTVGLNSATLFRMVGFVVQAREMADRSAVPLLDLTLCAGWIHTDSHDPRDTYREHDERLQWSFHLTSSR
jgi:hypothetical protein